MTVTEPPEAEPITLAEAKRQCIVSEDDADDNDLLTSYIKAARAYVENYTRRVLITQTRTLKLDGLPAGSGSIELPGGVVQEATLKYLDANGVQQTLDDAVFSLTGDEPALLALAFNANWPAYRAHGLPVEIEFVVGYPPNQVSPEDLRANVPEDIKLACAMLVAHWYKNREPVNIGNLTTELQFTVEALLASYRIF